MVGHDAALGHKAVRKSGPGSVSDAAGPLLDALKKSAQAAGAEHPGDPKVMAAVKLGWVMKELTEAWPLKPLPHDLVLDGQEQCQAQALELTEQLDRLDLDGLDWELVEHAVRALRRGPAPHQAHRVERTVTVALTGCDARLAKAYMLGNGLRALIGGERPEPADARQLKPLVAALDSLSSDLESHAARGVAGSIARWPKSAATADPAFVDAQVSLWRSVVVGEKQATELLEPKHYLDAAKQLEGKFIRRAFTSVWFWALLIVVLLIFGGAVYVLFVAKNAGKVAVGASGVLAAVGITWKGIGGMVGKATAKLEVPVWGAELDAAVTDAITLSDGASTTGGLSYADRSGRAVADVTLESGARGVPGKVAAERPRRGPGSLPFPGKRPGTVNHAMPFDHLVVVMMENHSFDNLLGALSRSRRDVDGLAFDASGNATNANPGSDAEAAPVRSFALPNTAQAKNLSQSWKATHEQIDSGAMDGFVRSASGHAEPMGYYPPEVVPFAYSLASTFTLANRWFCSLPGPTYPNRRFLLAGTAYGGTATDLQALLDDEPPNGTIFDRLSEHNISWADYFEDVPMTFVIKSIVAKHLDHHHHIDKFFEDCRSGKLPAVSFVDPGVGVLPSIAGHVPGLGFVEKNLLRAVGVRVDDLDPAETEEDPQSMYHGEAWAHQVVEAVLRSPAWSRTLLVYTYDEHGGYYDHVAPPLAIPPDEIPPKLQPGDPPGGYDAYGPRVPAVVVSPYARPGGVTDVVHDHTSVLATIEAKWNLPALTSRDANAATVMDFLDLSTPALLTPPEIQGPLDSGPSGPVQTG